MGRASRRKPVRLADKLSQIRTRLGLSQNELINYMGLTGELKREEISDFERGVREPSLLVILQYANTAGVFVEVLIDNNLDLPEKLPCSPKHPGIPRKKTQGKSKIDR